jgi:secreted trypsin-like serine protease
VLLKRKLSVLWAAAIMLGTLLACSGIALAITYGTEDTQNKYAGVGALVDRLGAYCSGTLVDGKNDGPPVFVTAAHCDEDGKVYVSFEPQYVAEGSDFAKDGEGVDEYSGTLTGDPQWYLRGHDIAVVVFDNPDDTLRGLPKAQLPAKGSLSNLEKGRKFTAVGYGVTSGTSYETDWRRYAVSKLTSINRYYLGLSQNQNQGNGGTCYGDSGGPNFVWTQNSIAETNINAALTNTGDAMCKSKNTVVRLDTLEARDFLGNYVALP